MLQMLPRVSIAGCEPCRAFFGKAILAPTQDTQHWIMLLAADETALKAAWEGQVPDRPFERAWMFDAAMVHAVELKYDGDL